jgi:hypothetical protein
MTTCPGEDVGRQLSDLLTGRLAGTTGDGISPPGRALAVLPGGR